MKFISPTQLSWHSMLYRDYSHIIVTWRNERKTNHLTLFSLLNVHRCDFVIIIIIIFCHLCVSKACQTMSENDFQLIDRNNDFDQRTWHQMGKSEKQISERQSVAELRIIWLNLRIITREREKFEKCENAYMNKFLWIANSEWLFVFYR